MLLSSAATFTQDSCFVRANLFCLLHCCFLLSWDPGLPWPGCQQQSEAETLLSSHPSELSVGVKSSQVPPLPQIIPLKNPELQMLLDYNSHPSLPLVLLVQANGWVLESSNTWGATGSPSLLWARPNLKQVRSRALEGFTIES